MTAAFQCGCSATGSERCPTHRNWACHLEVRLSFMGIAIEVEPCPPCQRAKWASVNLDGRATPTRGRGRP